MLSAALVRAARHPCTQNGEVVPIHALVSWLLLLYTHDTFPAASVRQHVAKLIPLIHVLQLSE